jgi:cell division septation protein DedD
MATSTSDEGFHEIQLNGKQLVFLFMAVTVVSVVIFLCGVLVGRGVRVEPAESLTAQATTASPPPAVAAEGASAGATPPATEELSYPDRLASPEPAREQLRAAAPPVRREEAPPTAPAPAPARLPAPAASQPAAAAEPGGTGYAIQLAALSKREEADGIARRLTGKGYPAYVLSPEAGAPAVFRVRVGKFTDRREAESVRARLQKEEQFNPWIVR